MIRINLLPRKKRAERSDSQQGFMLALLAVLLVEVLGCLGFHSYETGKLKEQQRKNAELTTQIEQSRRAVANHAEVKAKLAELRARESAIASLQSARTGPTAVLLELARILTPGRGPTVDPARLDQLRRENPLALFNPNWDARRLWLAKFTEDSRHVTIEGIARDGEDVSEFARRLNLSGYFHEVELLPGSRDHTADTNGLDVARFQLKTMVRY